MCEELRKRICTECGAPATIIEAGVCICTDCRWNHPELVEPILEARRREAQDELRKDERLGL